MNQKTFYIISSLSTDHSFNRLAKNTQYETEKEAIAGVKELLAKRTEQGLPMLSFYILKAVAVIGPVTPTVAVTKLK